MIQYSSIINYYISIYSKVNFTWLGEKERERKRGEETREKKEI